MRTVRFPQTMSVRPLMVILANGGWGDSEQLCGAATMEAGATSTLIAGGRTTWNDAFAAGVPGEPLAVTR